MPMANATQRIARTCLLGLLWVLPIGGARGQVRLAVRVEDGEKRGIADVQLRIGGTTRFSAGNGECEVVGHPSDTVYFSHLAYSPRRVIIHELMRAPIVRMRPREYAIPDVRVASYSQYTERARVGNDEWKLMSGGWEGPVTIAVHIANPRRVKALVDRVRFLIGHGWSDDCQVRVSILGVSPRGIRHGPGRDTLLRPQAILGAKLQRTTKLPVREAGVFLPPDGAFVSLELLANRENPECKCPMLLARTHDPNGIFWVMGYHHRWTRDRIPSGRGDYVLPNVSLDVLYPQ